jgi:hypothetical protein
MSCRRRHRADDHELGEPLDPDTYDCRGAVVWNGRSTRLWARTVQLVNGAVARLLDVSSTPTPYSASADPTATRTTSLLVQAGDSGGRRRATGLRPPAQARSSGAASSTCGPSPPAEPATRDHPCPTTRSPDTCQVRHQGHRSLWCRRPSDRLPAMPREWTRLRRQAPRGETCQKCHGHGAVEPSDDLRVRPHVKTMIATR